MKSRVITISREFGSGGRTIGKMVAQELGMCCGRQITIFGCRGADWRFIFCIKKQWILWESTAFYRLFFVFLTCVFFSSMIYFAVKAWDVLPMVRV